MKMASPGFFYVLTEIGSFIIAYCNIIPGHPAMLCIAGRPRANA